MKAIFFKKVKKFKVFRFILLPFLQSDKFSCSLSFVHDHFVNETKIVEICLLKAYKMQTQVSCVIFNLNSTSF